MTFDLPLGAAGLTLDAINLRLYAGKVRLSVPGGVALVAADTTVDYSLTGLPDEPGVFYAATLEAPSGVYHSRTWVGGGLPAPPTPPLVIIPFREDGGAITTALLKDGATAGTAVTLEDLGTPEAPGDFAAYGWPTALPGERWMLRWQIGNIFFERDWRLAPLTGTGLRHEIRAAVENRIIAAYGLALEIIPDLELQVGGENRQKWEVLAEHQYLRGYYRRATARRLSASDWALERSPGLAVVQLMITPETGDDAADMVIEAIRPAFFTSDDGLQFEEAPRDVMSRRDGSHWLDVTEFPFYADGLRRTA